MGWCSEVLRALQSLYKYSRFVHRYAYSCFSENFTQIWYQVRIVYHKYSSEKYKKFTNCSFPFDDQLLNCIDFDTVF